MTPIPIEKYQEAMREAICGMCVCFAEDRQGAGRCVHENSGQCSLFAHLEEVVDVISGVDSDSIEAYTQTLRRKVCANCDHQDERGICDLRDSRGPLPNWCILDAYFNLIVGAVEEVQTTHAAGVP
jgi:hypothetical protein